MLIDGEDPALANWSRYINHSSRPNLDVERAIEEGDPPRPLVTFVVSRPVVAGEELTFDYGDGFELDVLGFEE